MLLCRTTKSPTQLQKHSFSHRWIPPPPQKLRTWLLFLLLTTAFAFFIFYLFFSGLLVCLFFVVCVQITTRQDKKEERVTQFVICHCLCKCCGLLNLWLNLCGCGCATGPSLLTNKMMPLYVNLYVSFLIYIRNKKIKLSRWPNKCMCDTPSRRNNFSNPSSLTVTRCSALSIPYLRPADPYNSFPG